MVRPAVRGQTTKVKSFLASVDLYLGPLGDVVDSLVCFWTLGSEIRAPVSHVNWHLPSLPPPSPRHLEGRSVSLVVGNLHSLTRPIPLIFYALLLRTTYATMAMGQRDTHARLLRKRQAMGGGLFGGGADTTEATHAATTAATTGATTAAGV